jgi:hypothetical protein
MRPSGSWTPGSPNVCEEVIPMAARHVGRAQAAAPQSAGELVAAGVQLVNELLRQLQARAAQEDDGAMAKLTRRVARLKERNRALEECVVFLASAVGMCPACFGKVPDCPACRGQGQPGKLAVDPTAFAEIVAPLFQRQPERLDELTRQPIRVDVDRGRNGSSVLHTPSTPETR